MDYKKVIKDFSDGTIDKDKWELIFDNDGGYWRPLDIDEEENYDLYEEETGRMTKKYGKPNGYKDLVALARAAGINSEWV